MLRSVSEVPTGKYVCRFALTCETFDKSDVIPVSVPRLGAAPVTLNKLNPCVHGGGCGCWRSKLEAEY